MAISWREFQDFTISTAMYSGAGSGSADEMEYCALGMGEEALEVGGSLIETRCFLFERLEVLDECGDVAYYIAREYAALGVYPGDVVIEASASPGFTRDHYLEFARCASKAVGMVKKAMRKGGHDGVVALRTDDERRAKFLLALDAMLAALCCLIGSIGSSLDEVLERNRNKLLSRKATGTLHERPAPGDAR